MRLRQATAGSFVSHKGPLGDGGACGAANWPEVARKVRAHGRNWDLARALLASYGVQVAAVTADDAE